MSSTTVPNFRCSVCGRRIKVQSQLDMPIFDPNTGFSVCRNCIKEIYGYIEEDEHRRLHAEKKTFADTLGEREDRRQEPQHVRPRHDLLPLQQDA